MNIMIHACPQRMWYVEEFLIPSMLAQGISREEIEIWNDTDGKGNLFSCMESFRAVGAREGGTWHVQDDVVIAKDFAQRLRAHDLGIVCGFGCANFGATSQHIGRVPAVFMWYSFQCIRIPNELAGACAEWFFTQAQHRSGYLQLVIDGKHDDKFWREFMLEEHRDLFVTNLAPNLADHVDYLIGGTVINRARQLKINRSAFWEDEQAVPDLEAALQRRKAAEKDP